MSLPFISIVIPLYNKEKSIFRAITSILLQDMADFEVIVVDDGSSDNSGGIVNKICNEKIQYFRKDNGGVSSARNYGVERAAGDWVLFLDADDYLEPNAISVILDTINNYSDTDFFCFNHFVEQKGEKILFSTRYRSGLIQNPFYEWCIGSLMPRAGAAVYRKELLLQHPFKESLRRYEDAECLFEIMRNTKLYRCNIPIMTYCLDNTSASHARDNIQEDYIGHLSMKGKSMWEQYALWQLYLQGVDLYPNEMKKLYSRKEMRTLKVKIADYYLRKRKYVLEWRRTIKRLVKNVKNH